MIEEAERKRIISNSINAAICIDDEFASPYSGISDNRGEKELYQSFRREGKCALDIYKYTDIATFESDRDHLLNHKELMILDWELNAAAPEKAKFEDALKVLDSAVGDKHIRYVTIYTQSTDVSFILLQIYSYFTGTYFIDNISERLENLIEFIADELEKKGDVEDGIGFLDVLLKEKSSGFSLSSKEEQVRILKDVKKSILKEVKEENKLSFCPNIKSQLEKLFTCEERTILSYYEITSNSDINSFKFKSEDTYPVDVYNQQYILVNNTLVFVLNKSETSVSDVYSKITTAISNIPNQRTLLLSLLMKDVLYKNTGKGGQGLGKVTDNMLLHHWHSYEYQNIDDLIGFLILCMKEDISESLRNEIESSLIQKLFTQEPEETKVVAKKEELALFNKIITFVAKDDLPNKNHQIKTGDIFKLTSQAGQNDYLICISQSCDCLRADKIHKNFAFALGSTFSNISTALRDIEREDKYSIIGKNTAIEWQNCFMTIHIEENEFDVDTHLKVNIENQETELEYVGFLKDFYAQRIVNKIFNNSLRIGVDLPHLV